MIVAITGHRPDKLWGYNLNRREYEVLMQMMCNYFMANNVTEVIDGCALGIDTVAALTVIDMKKAGVQIKLTCAIPCRNQESLWKNPLDLARYKYILENADEVVYVKDGEYDESCMNKRNEWMVDRCHRVLSVWDGTKGGTFDCIRYANIRQKHIDRIEPRVITEFVQQEVLAAALAVNI